MKAEIEGDGKKGTEPEVKNGRIYIGKEYEGKEVEWAIEVQEE